LTGQSPQPAVAGFHPLIAGHRMSPAIGLPLNPPFVGDVPETTG